MSRPFRSLVNAGLASMLLAGTMMAARVASAAPAPSDPAALASVIKAKMLAMINDERREFGLAPVALDPLASSVADALCKRQVYDRSVGHISTDGLKPYHRYSFAGGLHGITENTAAWSRATPYTADEIETLVEESVTTMLHESPPDDGHRRAILDRHATHVGLGFAWRGGEVRIAHEFVRRYLRWTAPPPRELADGERASCSAVPAPGWSIAAMSVHFEPAPTPLGSAAASRIVIYDLPATRTDYTPVNPAAESPIVRASRASAAAGGSLVVGRDGAFSFAIPFDHGPGIYTLVAWLRKGDELVAASNVSIRVRAGNGRDAKGGR